MWLNSQPATDVCICIQEGSVCPRSFSLLCEAAFPAPVPFGSAPKGRGVSESLPSTLGVPALPGEGRWGGSCSLLNPLPHLLGKELWRHWAKGVLGPQSSGNKVLWRHLTREGRIEISPPSPLPCKAPRRGLCSHRCSGSRCLPRASLGPALCLGWRWGQDELWCPPSACTQWGHVSL